ncbi:MAG: hypothetical protein E4H18_03375, partial [Hyphomicrobiales bacterium]
MKRLTLLSGCLMAGMLLALSACTRPADRGQALLQAAKSGQADSIRALLESGAPADAATERGVTALHYAAQSNRADIVKLLAAAGAAPNAHGGRGHSPAYRRPEQRGGRSSGAPGCGIRPESPRLHRPHAAAFRGRPRAVLARLGADRCRRGTERSERPGRDAPALRGLPRACRHDGPARGRRSRSAGAHR